MKKSAPCYSSVNYYEYFDIDFSNKKVLDIGSSIGSFEKSKKFSANKKFLDSAKRYITLDINPESGADIIGDAHELPFEDNEFDIVIANNIIEHLYDPGLAISEVFRVLKNEGEVFFTIPFLYPIHERPHDYVRYTEYGLMNLFNDFEKTEINNRGGVFSVMANFVYKTTHALDRFYLGSIARTVIWPLLWLFVQLDVFDKSDLFVRTYFGKATK